MGEDLLVKNHIRLWVEGVDRYIRFELDLPVNYERYYDQQVARKKAKVFGTIKRVIFNDPATIILWSDGTKTVVKCAKDEKFDPEKGLAMAIAKKAIGNEGWYYDIFKEFLPKEENK